MRESTADTAKNITVYTYDKHIIPSHVLEWLFSLPIKTRIFSIL